MKEITDRFRWVLPTSLAFVAASCGTGLFTSKHSSFTQKIFGSLGYYHTCVRNSDSIALCWGANSVGQLGNGNTGTSISSPLAISGGLNSISWISGGGISNAIAHSCAINNGQVLCWGENTEGQLGINSLGGVYDSPQQISSFSSVTEVSAGGTHTCAIADGSPYCWGDNADGQVGDGGQPTDRSVPTSVSGGAAFIVKSISAGFAHSCASYSDGSAYCWGENGSGQVGDTTTGVDRITATLVTGLSSGVTQVCAGGQTSAISHSCAIVNGGVYCWGDDTWGQMGDGASGGNHPTAQTVSGLSEGSGVTEIACGGVFSCAIVNRQVKCWGDNSQGQMGNGSPGGLQSNATTVSGLTNITHIAAGNTHVCAQDDDGNVYCWGGDSFGEVGNGTPLSDQPYPVKISF